MGYPGWHIECSGISLKYNGEYLDLHCGGISRQGERLLAPVREYVASNCFGGHDRKPPELRAAKLGNEAGIIGAAAL